MKLISKHNTSCVVVSYNPEEANFYHLVSLLSSTYSEVCIIDNNSTNFGYLESLIKGICKNIKVIRNKTNLGIAAAINIGIREVYKPGIDWILTFDQDSLPSDNFVSVYNGILMKENNIGLLCPGYTNQHTMLMKEDEEVIYYNSLDLITSGMLHNVDVFNKIGLYNEPMFIDYVDFEYTLRVAQYYDTFKVSNNTLFHVIGEPLIGSFFGKKIYSSNHSPIRRYFKSRNLVYIYRKWHRIYPQWTSAKLCAHIRSIVPLLLLENNRWRKICSIIKGLYDGINFQR